MLGDQEDKPCELRHRTHSAELFTEIQLDAKGGEELVHIEEGDALAASVENAVTKQGLNTWRLAALMFFTVSGGPYGLEPLIAAVGPFYSILGIVLVPWVWGLPSGFMTAELSSAIPEMGGYIAWVQRSMGDFWSFQNALWNLFTGLLDNSLYPLLFIDYIENMMDLEFSYFTRSSLGIIMVILLSVVNVVGVDVVGDGAGVFGIFVLLPFVFLVIVGFMSPKLDPSDWVKEVEHPEWGLYVSILLWNTGGYDSVGACASEVENPGKLYPRAMLITICTTTLLYVLPLLVGVCFGTDYDLWEDGYFVSIGELVGGYWLKLFILLAGCISALGLLNSNLCTTSRAVACMAGYGYLPSRLAAIHPKYGTPVESIAVNAAGVIVMVLSGLDFEAIAQLSMFLYTLTLLFEFASLILLRHYEPHLKRPFRIPGGMCGVYLISIPPCLCCFVLIFLSGPRTWLICGGICLLCMLLLIPYYYYSGKPVILPGPLACLFRLCRRTPLFRPLYIGGGRVGGESDFESNNDSSFVEEVELPDTVTRNEPQIDWEKLTKETTLVS